MGIASRCCMDCGRSISACMGFVLAVDFVVFAKSTRNGGNFLGSVRERCGRCVEKILQEEVLFS